MPATAPSASVSLSWSRDVAGKTAVLQRLASDDAWDEIARTDDTELLVTGLERDRAYVFAMADADENGTLAPEGEWGEVRVAPVADESTPALPETPANFAVVQDGELLRGRWDAATDGVTRTYELRFGTTWEDGVLILGGVEATASAWSWLSSGDATIHIKSVDALGRRCLVAATYDITIEQLEDHEVDQEHDEGGGGWTGPTVNLEDDGSGGLQLRALGRFGAETSPFGSYDGVPWAAKYWPVGTYEMDPVTVGQEERQRVDVVIDDLERPQPQLRIGEMRWPVFGTRREDRDGQLLPRGAVGASSRTSWRGTPLDPVDIGIEIDTSPTAAGAWDGWRPYVPGTYTFWRVRLRVTLRADGLRIVKMPTLVIRRLLKNRKREGIVVCPGGGPIEVTYSSAFQRAPAVVPGLLSGSTAVRVVVSTVTATSFFVDALDATGTSVAATVHWHALGT